MNILKFSQSFRQISNQTALIQLGTTGLFYFLFLGLAILFSQTLWVAVGFCACAGITAVRLYMLQHDCMHRCFVTARWANDLIGVLLSPFTLTAFYAGRFNHGQHHSHVGDLDHRETFEINVLTLDEYRALPMLKKALYRLYRSPITLLIIGPFLVFGVANRFPKNTLKQGLLLDVMGHNLLLIGFGAGVYALAGTTGLAIWAGSVYLGVSLGAIIPYVEHNFEQVAWGRRPDLSHEEAALKGSAVLDFGDFFHLVTANIGFHDVHHLNPMVPSYNLKDCYEALDDQGLLFSTKIGLKEAMSCFRWKLWDEEQRCMVTFAAA